MAPPFAFPSSLRDLERDTGGDGGDDEPSLRPQNPVAVTALRAADLEEFVKVAAAEKRFGDGSLAISMIREIGRTDPKDYARDDVGADNVGRFLVELADCLPKLMSTNIGVLVPHFGGESYKIRNALVGVLGNPLVFSQDKSIYEAVESAFITIYTRKSPTETAKSFLNLAIDCSIGDLAALESLVSSLVSKAEISSSTLSALWDYFCFNINGVRPVQSRGALSILCMAAKSSPNILGTHLQHIIDIGFGRWAKEEPLLARTAFFPPFSIMVYINIFIQSVYM